MPAWSPEAPRTIRGRPSGVKGRGAIAPRRPAAALDSGDLCGPYGQETRAGSACPVCLRGATSCEVRGSDLAGERQGDCSGAEHCVDGLAGPVIGVRPQVGVGVQGLGRTGMTEPGLHDLH